jgi:Leucine-rich repeat (LRR) protein
MALRQYQICRQNLQHELGVVPSNATTALYEEIKAWKPGSFADRAQPPKPVEEVAPAIAPGVEWIEQRSPIRKIVRPGLIGLIAAGFILGIGSMYWAGVPDSQASNLDPNVQDLSQIPLVTATNEDVLTLTNTVTEEPETAFAAEPLPSETMTVRPTRTPARLEPVTSLSNTGISENEQAALITLYDQTDGTNWENAEGWLSDRSPCEWYGVTCRGGKIIELELTNNRLSGSLPAEIGQLENLENLDLRNNQLNGSLPPELGNLFKLRHLYLSGNRELSGSIPPELGKLSNLQDLELAHWESGGSLLSGEIPPELGNLKELRVLKISVSLLRGPLPVELCGLTNLMDLFLDSNRLSGPIPTEIGNMTNLGALDLGGNDFEGSIPPELGNLLMLTYLAVGDSLVSGEIPAELGNLVRLRHLFLDNTNLSGPLPLTLMNLNLRELYFFGTRVCEPTDEAFQAWLDGIDDLQSTGIVCAPEG